MKYDLKIQEDIQAIAIIASGIINTTVAEKMVLDTGLLLNTSGFKRCFFDLSQTEVDPSQTLTEMYMFINTFSKAGIDSSYKMAAYYISGREYPLHLEEAANHSSLQLKHFTDKDEALRWLCE